VIATGQLGAGLAWEQSWWRTLPSPRWSVISFEKEFVEGGDKEAEPAPNQQYDLDGQEPRLVRGSAILANKVSTKGTNWEIIMMNAMRLTLSNNVDGSGSGWCGSYCSSVGSVGAGPGQCSAARAIPRHRGWYRRG
jgi:hypothetical protein